MVSLQGGSHGQLGSGIATRGRVAGGRQEGGAVDPVVHQEASSSGPAVMLRPAGRGGVGVRRDAPSLCPSSVLCTRVTGCRRESPGAVVLGGSQNGELVWNLC